MNAPYFDQDPRTVVHWPEPAHLRLAQDAAAEIPCEIELADGSKQTGFLNYFTGRDDYLLFKPVGQGQASSSRIELMNVKQLLLTEPVKAEAFDVSVDDSADGDSASQQTQVYNIEFHDGEIHSGETSGHVNMQKGIFLYSQAGEAHLRRSFIPTSAVSYFQIGDPMGKLLMEENAVSEHDLKQAIEKQHDMRKQLLGDYLIDEAYVTHEQLEEAMLLQKVRPSLRLGEALIEMGALTGAELEAALTRQRSNRSRPLSQILIEMGVLDQGTLQKVHAKKKGLPTISLAGFKISSKVRALINAETSHRLGVVPLATEEDALIVAFHTSPEPETLKKLTALAGRRIVPVIATEEDISVKQEALYSANAEPDEEEPVAATMTTTKDHAPDPGSFDLDRLFDYSEPVDLTEPLAATNEADFQATLLQVTERLLSAATASGTLDIHIENKGGQRVTQIRYTKA